MHLPDTLKIRTVQSELHRRRWYWASEESFLENMVSEKVPKYLWGYGLVHRAVILSGIPCGKTGWAGI